MKKSAENMTNGECCGAKWVSTGGSHRRLKRSILVPSGWMSWRQMSSLT